MKKLLTASLLAAAISGMSVQAQQTIDNPMTQAMLDVYASELAANPRNAEIYLRRANEYYKFNQYLRALADVDKTLEYAPESNRDLRFQAYMLRADIYQMLGKHQQALDDFSAALKLDSTSFMALYQKANEEYELGDYQAAKYDYTRLRSLHPRSVEALTGLARVAVKENNLGLASEYMDGAVEMMSADSDIYIRRASVRKMQGNNTGAVEDLLMAISIDNNSRAFQELIDMANDDYPAVITGLSTSISYAPQQGMLYYIRAFIAQAHEHYVTALADYRKLIDQNMYDYAGLYNSMAQCQLALCRYPQALDNVSHAVMMDPANGEFYITRARILYAQGKNTEALAALKDAEIRGISSDRLQVVKALVKYSEGDYNAANDIYAAMTIDNPDVMQNYIYRAWVLVDGMKDATSARPLYNRVVSMTAPTDDEDSKVLFPGLAAIRSYRGFALLFSGDKTAAVKWADDLCRNFKDTDGSLNFTAACLYAQASALPALSKEEKAELTDKGFKALEKALQLGYGNLYELTTVDTGRVSLAPLRSDTRFNDMIARYSHLFE